MHNEVKSNAVNVGIYDELKYPKSLDEYIKNNTSIPINLFDKNGSIIDAISLANSFLVTQGQGTVVINPTSSQTTVYLQVHLNESLIPVVNFITYGSHAPKSSRPYTDEKWIVGDKIYNIDINTNRCIGWICTEEGTPGKWQQFGNIKAWHTQIEELDYLPDASELQVGRQVIYHNNGVVGLYFCDKIGDTYQWIQQNMAFGTEEQRPTIADNNWWYFNTTIGFPQWYDATNSVWRTIYDKDTYDQMWSDYRSQFESDAKNLLQTGYDDVLSKTKSELDSTYKKYYDDWLNKVNTQYELMIKEPVDDYLNNHPSLIGQRYNIINSTVTKSATDDAGNRTYTSYEVENGSIIDLSVLPTVFVVNFLADADSSSLVNYFRIFNTSYKIVNATGEQRVWFKSGYWISLLISKNSNTCVGISIYDRIEGPHETERATQYQLAHVTLSDAVDSTKDNMDGVAATPLSVKTAYDLAASAASVASNAAELASKATNPGYVIDCGDASSVDELRISGGNAFTTDMSSVNCGSAID